MKQKVEIIISNSYLEELLGQLESLGVNGYTALEIFRGKGTKTGETLSEGLLPITRSSLVILIVNESLAESIFQKLEAYILERHGIIFSVPILKILGPMSTKSN
ncbi:MAG: hypothetical protein NXI20_25255 [bacterium]|jgi:nitrogen regulatory protein PII|nr:hypothetical protein [bacterium]